jgi:tRNA threonylcarbamoyladenosine biosynthesis protein TsaE
MKVLSLVSHSEDETVALAAKLAMSFVEGDVVVLKGALGSGKTTFVRALATARGINESLVNSPSYTFVNEYDGDPPLYHIDLYRLGEVSELIEIGWNEYLGRNGIVFVEWGERAGRQLPQRYYQIEFGIIDAEQRQIDLSLVQP